MEQIFQEFPKIARFSREIIITEKIDGTNGQILITEDKQMFVGSRTRWITPQDDNHGFARWCQENKEELLKLGQGRHFGEWWGNGIQRGYDLPRGEKRFSLFNTSRWKLNSFDEPGFEQPPRCCHIVPILYQGTFDTQAIQDTLNDLISHGSYASDGYKNPEGIVIFHIAGNVGFKKTIKNDDKHKSEI
jgi:hypothetical protein